MENFLVAHINSFTTWKTLIAIKTIVKTRSPRDEIENDVTNSETLNLETFFSQATCKVASFSLILDLMHECYVISFPNVFYFLIWRSSCFVAYFHISTSQKKIEGTGLAYCFLPLERVKITRNWNFHPQTKQTFIL